MDTDRKMIVFSVVSCLAIGGVLYALAPLFPNIYNTSDEVRTLATGLIRVSSVLMPLYAFCHASYFTLRTGGKTFITFLSDSCFVWAINIPVAYVLSRYTGLPLVPIYFICQGMEILKAVVGYVLLKKKIWVNNIVETIA